MEKQKKYKTSASALVKLIAPMGSCLATDKITVDGELVGYMYREETSVKTDCGWRFLSGSESQDYADNADNWAFYDVNTIANCDTAIIPYLHLSIGTELERIPETIFFQHI
jgi:hypothetical protein